MWTCRRSSTYGKPVVAFCFVLCAETGDNVWPTGDEPERTLDEAVSDAWPEGSRPALRG